MARKPKTEPKPVVKKETRRPNELIHPRNGAETMAETAAQLMIEGLCQNTLTARRFSSAIPEPDVTEAFSRTLQQSERVAKGDMGELIAILAAQTVTLNAIFTDLMIRAQNNVTSGVEVFERLMRLGLRAQSQSRATAESISTILHPPVFAKQLQANIANGGPQQINNGSGDQEARRPRARRENKTAPTKLLGSETYVERIERLDAGTAGQASSSHPQVATVESLNRTTNRRRQKTRVA